jgi:YbbR domain-containing protein
MHKSPLLKRRAFIFNTMKNKFAKIFIAALSLIAACIIWLHVATEKEYEIEIPFNIEYSEIPQHYIVANSLPVVAYAKCKGTGKNLLAQLIAGGIAQISLKNYSYGSKTIPVLPEFFKPAASDIAVVEIVYPKEITVQIDRKSKKNVSIAPRFVVIPEAGMVVREDVEFRPLTVSIEGPETKIAQIEQVYTADETLRGFNTTTSFLVALAKPDYNVKVIPDTVTAMVKIEQISTKKIFGIKVELESSDKISGKLIPEYIAVTISGAASTVNRIDASMFRAVVTYSDIASGGTDNIKPTIICIDKNVGIISTDPEYVKLLSAK